MTHKQGTDGKLTSHLKPRLEFVPSPGIHANLAPATAFAVPDQDGATAVVQVAFGQSERLVNPQPGTPQDHDQPA
jgi:hypothetical protein